MKQIKGTMGVWLPSYGHMHDIDRRGLNAVYVAVPDMRPSGWTKVGTAEVVVTIDDQGDINARQIATLQEAKRKVQADFAKRVTDIDAQIQSLLAIENEVA